VAYGDMAIGDIAPWAASATLQRSSYRQHCAQRNAPVFKLLRCRFWGFSPSRGDTLHRLGWNLPNFTPIGATIRI